MDLLIEIIGFIIFLAAAAATIFAVAYACHRAEKKRELVTDPVGKKVKVTLNDGRRISGTVILCQNEYVCLVKTQTHGIVTRYVDELEPIL